MIMTPIMTVDNRKANSFSGCVSVVLMPSGISGLLYFRMMLLQIARHYLVVSSRDNINRYYRTVLPAGINAVP